MAHWTDRFEAKIDVSPAGREADLSDLPARRGVTLLATREDEPIILMTAADMRSRVRNRMQDPSQDDLRKKTPDLRAITGRIWYTPTFSHFETDWVYLELARAIWPEDYPQMLAFRSAWFVHVDPASEHPRLRRTRDVFAREGQYAGPFRDARSAEAFITALEEAFGLCRNFRCLVQAPHGPTCTYAQLGKCLRVCDGATSLEAYRRVMSEVARVATGDRQELLGALRAEMKEHAARLDYERAAAVKTRLDRLATLDGPAYQFVRPAEALAFVIVQPGSGVGRVRVVLCDRGRFCDAGELTYPLEPQAVAPLLDRLAELAAAPLRPGREERWRLGLVTQYLFASAQRRGVILPWRPGLTPGDVVEEVQASSTAMKLRARADRGSKRTPAEGSATSSTGDAS